MTDYCNADGYDMENNCCLNSSGNSVIGLDLRGCDISNIGESFFKSDVNLTQSLSSLKWIDLSNNSVTQNETDLEAFRGMTSLEVVFLITSFPNCIGTNKAWNIAKEEDEALNCTGMKSYCNVLEQSENFTCPSNSHCSNDGPGLIACECDDGYFGYKCLKSGTFPYALFYSILTVCTVVLSAFFWWTQRRHVKKRN